MATGRGAKGSPRSTHRGWTADPAPSSATHHHRAHTLCCGQAQAGTPHTHHHHGHGGTGRHHHRAHPCGAPTTTTTTAVHGSRAAGTAKGAGRQAARQPRHAMYLPCCCPRTCQSTGHPTTSPSVLHSQEWSATVTPLNLTIRLVFGTRRCPRPHAAATSSPPTSIYHGRNLPGTRKDAGQCAYYAGSRHHVSGFARFEMVLSGKCWPRVRSQRRRVPKTKRVAKLSGLTVALDRMHGARWSRCRVPGELAAPAAGAQVGWPGWSPCPCLPALPGCPAVRAGDLLGGLGLRCPDSDT